MASDRWCGSQHGRPVDPRPDRRAERRADGGYMATPQLSPSHRAHGALPLVLPLPTPPRGRRAAAPFLPRRSRRTMRDRFGPCQPLAAVLPGVVGRVGLGTEVQLVLRERDLDALV